MKVTEWAIDRIKEALELVAKEEARKLSIVKENHAEKYRLPAAYHRASRGGKEALRCHTCARVAAGKKHTSRWSRGPDGMVEEEVRLHSTATEKDYEQILEEVRELEEKKSSEALLLVTRTEKAHFDTISM